MLKSFYGKKLFRVRIKLKISCLIYFNFFLSSSFSPFRDFVALILDSYSTARDTKNIVRKFNLFMTFHSINYALLDRIVSRYVFSSGKSRPTFRDERKGSTLFDSSFIWWHKPNFLLCALEIEIRGRKVSKSGKVGTKRTPDNFDHTIDEGKKFTVDLRSFFATLQPTARANIIFAFPPYFISLDCCFAESSGFLSVWCIWCVKS